MPKINILDKSVYSLIAAGEVIDKPSSVVKELLENSIDAGATNIVCEVRGGGIDYIRVTDNGCGIDESEMKVAFLPHTTSKIKDKEDLYNIGTLGFRGEALSTITAVSKVTMISRIDSSEYGYMLKINGGEVISEEPIGSSKGTTVISEDLFYNIPARRKFLRKPKLEEADITNIISRIILSHPNIAIQYIANDKIIFNSSGNGLFDAIYSIYGKEIVNNIIPVHFEKDDIKVDGYIGKVNFTKPNRTYQTLIVNGRYVINQTISVAIFKAYENYMMKNNFPFFVLNLNVKNNTIDVNVHPNKLDVKFSNSNELFEIFVTEISKILIDSINIQNVTITNNENIDIKPDLNLDNLQTIKESTGISFSSNNNTEENVIKIVEVDIESNNDDSDIIELRKKRENILNEANALKESLFQIKTLEPRSPNDNEEYLVSNRKESVSKTEQIDIVDQLQPVDNAIIRDDYKVIGTLFDTYIVVQFDDYIYLIDQHAGHERVLYDNYMRDLEQIENYSQSLLVPYTFSTNALEYSYILENLDIFKSLGFDVVEFGERTFRVTSVPLCLNNINIKTYFEDILTNMNSKIKSSTKELLKDLLAKTACKHAIKAYDKIDKSQIDYLLRLLDDTPVLLCPHGRPIVLKITEKEIEKWFKRIV